MKTSKLLIALALAVTTLLPAFAPSAIAGSACPPGSIWRAAREYRQHAGQTQSTQSEQPQEPVRLTFDEKITKISEEIALQKFDAAITDIDSMVHDGYWPPVESVNARLKKLKSPYRFVMTESTSKKPNPQSTTYRDPHGGGTLRIFDLAIREGKSNVRNWDSRQFLADDTGSVFDRSYRDRHNWF